VEAFLSVRAGISPKACLLPTTRTKRAQGVITPGAVVPSQGVKTITTQVNAELVEEACLTCSDRTEKEFGNDLYELLS